MPELVDISYSRDGTIAAIRGYYSFLVDLYLNESDIIEPPEEGWPEITPNSLQCMGKTDEVIELLRNLPYIRTPSDDIDAVQGAPECYFADWQSVAKEAGEQDENEGLRICSEGALLWENVPPHVIGLTYGGRDNTIFLLDTELGIVHWPECDGELRYNFEDDPSWIEPIQDDPVDYALEEEVDWRCDAPAWAIEDFFELLKTQFRKLHYIPISSRKVISVSTNFGSAEDGMVPMLQSIFHEHGWPRQDGAAYHKRECLERVETALEERYPSYFDR